VVLSVSAWKPRQTSSCEGHVAWSGDHADQAQKPGKPGLTILDGFVQSRTIITTVSYFLSVIIAPSPSPQPSLTQTMPPTDSQPANPGEDFGV
jgi:hypothetical protein